MPGPVRVAVGRLTAGAAGEHPAALDGCGDGWTLSHLVVVVGLERVTADGVESTAWIFTPDSQPDYVTDGLLLAAERMRDNADIE